MILRWRHPLVSLLLAASFCNTLDALSFPSFHSPTYPAWLARPSIASHSREFSVVANDEGIPQLEDGENPAADPANVLDRPLRGLPLPNGPNNNLPVNLEVPEDNLPDPSAEFFDDMFSELVSDSEAGTSTDAPANQSPEADGDFDENSASPPNPGVEVPGVDSTKGPQVPQTTAPLVWDPEAVDSQAFADAEEGSQSDGPSESPEAIEFVFPTPSKSNEPLFSSAPSTFQRPSPVSTPSPSTAAKLPTQLVPPVIGPTFARASPSVSDVIPSPPQPTSSVTLEVFEEPSPEDLPDGVEDDAELSATDAPIFQGFVLPSSPPSSIELSAKSSPTASTSASPDNDDVLVSGLQQNVNSESIGVSVTPRPSSGPSKELGTSVEPKPFTSPTWSAAASVTQVAITGAQLLPSQTSAPLVTDNAAVTAIAAPPGPNSIDGSATPMPTLVTILEPPAPSLTDPILPQAAEGVKPSATPLVPDLNPPISFPGPSEDSEPSSPPGDAAFTPSPPRPFDDANGGFTCIYFGSGSVEGFENVDPSFLSGSTSQFTVGQMAFPSLPQQYLSHTYGRVWSYSVPVAPNVPFEVILGFAEIYEAACRPKPIPGFRKMSVTVQNDKQIVDVMAEAGCGKALEKVFDVVSSGKGSIIVSLEGLSQQAILSTMCYRVTGDAPIFPLLVPPPAETTEAEETVPPQQVLLASSTPSPTLVSDGNNNDELAAPSLGYRCVNFGPRVSGGYKPYDISFVTGSTRLYRQSGVSQFSGLPLPYRYHLSGRKWKYRLNVQGDDKKKVILGFAEIFPEACKSNRGSSFRLFSVSIAGDERIVDVTRTVGCGAVKQIVFDEVLPQNGIIDVSLFARSGNAMLSTLCYDEVQTAISPDTAGPVPTAIPNSASDLASTPAISAPLVINAGVESPEPIAVISSPVPTAVPTSTATSSATPVLPVETEAPEVAPTSTRCFKFGARTVDGYTNVEVPDMGAGVDFFENKFAVIKGTTIPVAYTSHIFGEEFTFSVNAQAVDNVTVIMSFAEIFQPACREGYRVFRTKVGSSTNTIDVFKEAGCNAAFDVRVDGVTPTSEGIIDVSLKANKNFAMLSSVCLVEQSGFGTSNARPADSVDQAEESTDDREVSAEVSASDSEFSVTPTFAPAPDNSPLPKDNGMIVSHPDDDFVDPTFANDDFTGGDTVVPTPENILLDVGFTSQNVGESEPSPSETPSEPSDILLESDFSQTIVGHSGHPSPSQSSSDALTASSEGTKPADPLPVSSTAPVSNTDGAANNGAQFGEGPTAPSPAEAVEELLPSPEFSLQPTISSPAFDALPEESLAVLGIGDGNNEIVAENTGDGETSVEQTEPPVLIMLDLTSVTPEASPALSNPDLFASEEPNSPVSVTNNAGVITATPIVAAIPPGASGIWSPSDGTGTETTQDEVILGVPAFEQTGQVVTIPTISVQPSPVGGRQPIVILPPVGGFAPTPTPSIASIALLSPSPGPVTVPVVVPVGPIVTPASTVVVTVPSPVLTPPPSSTAQVVVGPSPAPSAIPDGESPSGVIIGEPAEPSPTSIASDISSGDAVTSPTPSPSVITSVTDAEEVIVEGSDVSASPPATEPGEAEVAPANPISEAPEDTNESIQVTDGSAVNEEDVKPDATGNEDSESGPTIVAGEFKDLIGTRSQSNGFAIGMGVLGALLVLLLLICLFFAIFRGRGGSYSYSSQYSAHKPSGYDPSQGAAYTDDIEGGAGEYGNNYSYGEGGQQGYNAAGNTLDSRPDTQNGSFTYEGAADGGLGGTIGSSGVKQDNVQDGSVSRYEGDAPDTFAEYSSLNMRENPVQYQSGTQRLSSGDYTQGATTVDYAQDSHTVDYTPRTNTGDYTQETTTAEYTRKGNTVEYSLAETFTMPNTEVYTAATQETEYRDRDRSVRETSQQHTSIQMSDSFNGDHSIARPAALQPESSGTQERNLGVTAGSSELRKNSAPVSEMINDHAATNTSFAQQVLSTGSSISLAAKSPYESNANLTLGNVITVNSTISRAKGDDSLENSALRGETLSTERVVIDAESSDLFLRDGDDERRTGTSDFGDEMHFASERGREQSERSDDGPWPWWWSEKKKPLPPIPSERAAEYSVGQNRGYANLPGSGQLKENDEVHRSKPVFRIHSLGERGSVSTVRREEPVPLSQSSKDNMLPTLPSQIRGDTDWRYRSDASEGRDETDSRVTGDDGFDELRRRREPYVKRVANRLSVNGSVSSQSSVVTAAYSDNVYAREGEARSSAGVTSATWISRPAFGAEGLRI